jgi:hypothetical protein
MNYLENVHRFRTLAIVGIVIAHTLFNLSWAPHDSRFIVLNALANESSIWFFFIAGFLFRHLSKNFDFRFYLAKKLKYVLLPYLVVSIPALIASLTFYDQQMPPSFDQLSLPVKTSLFLLTGKHLAPLWFVPTITLIFLMAPLLLWIDKQRWPYAALLLLIPLSAWLGRDGILIHFSLSGYWSAVSKAVYLLSAYIFGMFCSCYYTQVMAFVARWRFHVLIAVLVAFAIAVLNAGSYSVGGLYSFKLLSAPLILYALSRPAAAVLDRLAVLGHASFGIFFIHCYFLVSFKVLLGFMGLPPLLEGGIISTLALTALILSLSLIALLCIQTLLGKQVCRMLVGCDLPARQTQGQGPGRGKIIAAAR